VNDDELQQRLRRIDPAARTSAHPVTGPRAAALLESIMDTPLHTADHPQPSRAARPRGTRRWFAAAAAGAAAIAVGVGVLALTGGDEKDTAATSVAYSFGEPVDPTMMMCLPVTDYIPEPGLVGFKGTVTAATDTTVTVEVTKWFAGGDADVVELNTTDVAIPALDGVEFVVGGEYLVTVLDGQVLTCGLSGPADPVLEGIYEGWFAG
jgi:hypothetical protein